MDKPWAGCARTDGGPMTARNVAELERLASTVWARCRARCTGEGYAVDADPEGDGGWRTVLFCSHGDAFFAVHAALEALIAPACTGPR